MRRLVFIYNYLFLIKITWNQVAGRNIREYELKKDENQTNCRLKTQLTFQVKNAESYLLLPDNGKFKANTIVKIHPFNEWCTFIQSFMNYLYSDITYI